jgi:hypothetical protein
MEIPFLILATVVLATLTMAAGGLLVAIGLGVAKLWRRHTSRPEISN